ncbi:dephospho-CoA kinase [Dysgonomonas hofstadii]|uniref:Dephospho-CoA kinase n=1 Tax=Dysgonomonas hofstadii TaxID=637886 RepID=A0A840CKE3_9BACT|nr:dephospho-CoA kinase [Dysgonomonas hofstadii]MBB4035836.1 dephospho-CoA kinase [Dysgonomonas hofstadii]
MIILGITGGIGSGKSTVSQLFELCGVPVYIADNESKRLVATSPVIRKKLTGLFGEELYEGGVLNKALLASHIFNDKQKLETVNAIIHPVVAEDFNEWLKHHKEKDIVAHEAAILFESGFNKLMNKVVMVYTPLEIRIERTMARDNTSREKVQERIQNQMPDEEKAELSDFIIVNDGTYSLIEQVTNIIQQLRK